ncbi:hypothetical protein EV385_4441 [Krasilnikovia cinnamomea]|uniref:4-amino-4-deoxy-L-arabinose transferase-like glycosyltransferase n=1 Tax=Krasilnikovia cinnamomea TaxID=349313 RepID=A0A4Q7ZNF8_9ACTN|nr:hypothetical protein EV385_4441 [Krasilnikovia cinnamomea]
MLLGLASAFCAAVTLAWVAAGLRSAGRGLNVAEESFYLLSYRWWDVNLRTFTGAQYLYGPVFELLGHNIAHLRMFRIAAMVALHVVFGWSVMWWLRAQRPTAPASRLWEVTGILAIVAAGGVACGWLPLSPGYNDGTVVGGLLSMAFILFAAGHLARGRPIPLRLAFGYGTTVSVLLLVKWGSLAAVALTAIAAVALLWRRSRREITRLAGMAAVGVAAVPAMLAVFVPVTTVLAELVVVNRLITTAEGKPPTAVLGAYLTELGELTTVVVARHWLLLVAAAVAVLVRWLPEARLFAGVLAVVAFGRSLQQVWDGAGVHGGAGYTGRYVETLALPLIVAILVAVLVVDGERVHRRWAGPQVSATRSTVGAGGPRGWMLLLVLTLVPIGQAIGTTGPLMVRAIGGFAAWMAVLIAVFTGIEAASAICRRLVASVLAATVLAAGLIAVGGLWRYPYRTFPYRTATEAAGVPALASLRFHPAEAKAFAELRGQLRPYVEPSGRPMIGLVGAVLALDGRPVGEVWTENAGRNAASIRAACPGGKPSWGQRPPLLLYTRVVGAAEIAALRACGVDFAVDYRALAVYRIPIDPSTALNLVVYVPAAEFTVVAGYSAPGWKPTASKRR